MIHLILLHNVNSINYNNIMRQFRPVPIVSNKGVLLCKRKKDM